MSEISLQQPIGVFDSGVGGLIALRKLAELLPNENLLYLGDTARVPYGNRSPETIISYAKECVNFLLQHSVKQILVACNTVSAVALEAIAAISPVPVIGVVKPAADVVIREKYQRVGVVGTRTTIQSCSYELEIKKQRPSSVAIYAQACPLFVPVIEEGWEQHAVAHQIVEEYLAPLKAAKIEALILGCTHYSFLAKIIEKTLPNVHLIDSGAEAAMVVAQENKNVFSDAKISRKIRCYVTDLTPTFAHLAQQFLGLPLTELHHTEL